MKANGPKTGPSVGAESKFGKMGPCTRAFGLTIKPMDAGV
jgi:hypothetical protein